MVGGDFALIGTAGTDDGASHSPNSFKLFLSLKGHEGSCAFFEMLEFALAGH